MTDVEIGTIHIRYWADEDGDLLTSVSVDGEMPLVTVIGLLEMAKDELMHSFEDEDQE